MIVGEAGSGKSTALVVLQKAMGLLESRASETTATAATAKPVCAAAPVAAAKVPTVRRGVSWYGELKLQKVPERGKLGPAITWHGIDSITVNPRAVTLEQLYGRFDEKTREWSDGLVPLHFRALVSGRRERMGGGEALRDL